MRKQKKYDTREEEWIRTFVLLGGLEEAGKSGGLRRGSFYVDGTPNRSKLLVATD